MPLFDTIKAWAGRLRKAPERDTTLYPRLQNIGSWGQGKSRPVTKPTPANLRNFARTPYARRAINRIKNPIAMLKWEIAPKEGIDLNATLQKQIDVALACFKQPNSSDSFRSLLEQVIEDLLVCGAGPYEQQAAGDSVRPVWMWPVDGLSIQVLATWDGDPNGDRFMQSLGYGNVGGISGTWLKAKELVYIRMNPATDSPFGWGPLEVAFATINRKLGVGDFAGNITSNAQPANLLFFEGMDETAVTAFRTYWRNEIEGQGQTPINGGPQGGKPWSLPLRGSTDDALFLKYQDFLIREIFTAFGLSPMSGGIEKDVNRNTAEVTNEKDWDDTIKPLASLIAAQMTNDTIEGLLGFSQLEFRFLGLDREDEKNLADIYAIEYENNAITPNEYRQRRGLPPLESEWGDMVFADTEIAIEAARGAKQVNPKLTTKE